VLAYVDYTRPPVRQKVHPRYSRHMTPKSRPYVAAKPAIIGLSDVAALDYADLGNQVNVVAAGPKLNQFISKAPVRRRSGWPPCQYRCARSGPAAKLPTWCCGCARTDRRSSPGATIPIDGGQLAGYKRHRCIAKESARPRPMTTSRHRDQLKTRPRHPEHRQGVRHVNQHR